MNRRGFLSVIGGGVVLAAVGTAGGFLATRTPSKAYQPWKAAGVDYKEPRLFALSYAILAPNPHNRQPWKVDLSEDNVITLYVDTDRLLPHTDPFSRQITIGLGCFLEVLRVAAAENGYKAVATHFPEGFDNEKLDGRPVARIVFEKDSAVQKDPLFTHVLSRESLKTAYDVNKAVSDQVLDNLRSVVLDGVISGTTNSADKLNDLRKLTHDAMMVEMQTHRTYKESVDLFRIGKSEVEANPDGIDLNSPLLDTLALFGMFSREQALDMKSSAYKQGLDRILAPFHTSMGFVWLVTKENTRIDQLNAGRDWVRVNLAATGLGVGTQPVSQALQEYDEMKVHYADLHKKLAPEGGTVQMLGRLGYAEMTGPSPRWSLKHKIIKA